MDFVRFIRNLEEELTKPLPGQAAQLKMSSMVRIRELMNFIQPEDAVQSSVLVLLYPSDDQVTLVLMLRPDYNGVHSGQISLPGGKYEDGDESLIYTALREAKEEIGIDPHKVQIIGQLTELYIPPSNFVVTPVIGYLTSRPVFTPDPKEVAKIIEISLNELLDDVNIQQKKMNLRNGITMKVPSFYIDGNIIWGATAMMLSEFREITRKIKG
jgi:8-oxo-dGTP pyrophosphatase MutT (NUDIX family)